MQQKLKMDLPPGRLTYQQYFVGNVRWSPARTLSLALKDHYRYHWVLLMEAMDRSLILITDELWLNI